jgi:hypothetical protein
MDLHFPKHPELAKEVSAYLAARKMRPTTFGTNAANDPRLIWTLENGRELRSDLLQRIRMFMLTSPDRSSGRSNGEDATQKGAA